MNTRVCVFAIAAALTACGERTRAPLDRLATVRGEVTDPLGNNPRRFELDIPAGYREVPRPTGSRQWERGDGDPTITINPHGIIYDELDRNVESACYEGARVVTGERRGAGWLATCDHHGGAMLQVRYWVAADSYADGSPYRAGLQCLVNFLGSDDDPGMGRPSAMRIAQAEAVCTSLRVTP